MCLTGLCLLLCWTFFLSIVPSYVNILIKLFLLAPSEIEEHINNEEEEVDRSIPLEDEDEDEDELDTYAPELENYEYEENREESGMVFKELMFFIY